MGNTDGALDRNDGALPSTYDVEGMTGAPNAQVAGDSVGISFISPSMSGVKVYAESTANGDTSGMGLTYGAGPITVVYQSGKLSATTDETMVAAALSMGAIKISAGQGTQNTGATKTKTNEIGGSYTAGDITLVATQTKTPVTKANSLGVSYAIAPGLSFSAESGEITGTGANSATYMGLHVAF
jgi:predicted porin